MLKSWLEKVKTQLGILLYQRVEVGIHSRNKIKQQTLKGRKIFNLQKNALELLVQEQHQS